ncbi:TolC family protein [candidate division WOR-3 bacterium]|nr:TolC family protein [candidate division WOR-3 bacterium]
MLKFKVILILILIFSFSLYSLTFEEARKIALDKNRSMKISEFEVKKAEIAMRESWASFYPTVSLQSSYTRLLSVPQFEMPMGDGSTQYISLGFPDNFRNSLEVTFPVFTFGKRFAVKEIVGKSKDMQILQHETDKMNLIKDLITYYYGVVVAGEGFKIAEGAVERAEDHLRTARIQYNQGRITKLDLLQAETDFNSRKTELLNAYNGLELARSALNMMLGFSLDTLIEVEGQVNLEIDTFALDSLKDLALTGRPEIQSIKKLSELNSISKSLQYLSFLPDIAFVGSFSYDKPVGFLNEWDNDMTATIAVSWPIFQGFSRTNAIQKYRLTFEQAVIRENIVKEGIKMEIKNLLLSYRLNKQKLILSEEQLKRAKEAYEMADKQYKAGYISALDYKDIELGYRSAEFGHLNAQYNLIVSAKQIKVATMMDKEE